MRYDGNNFSWAWFGRLAKIDRTLFWLGWVAGKAFTAVINLWVERSIVNPYFTLFSNSLKLISNVYGDRYKPIPLKKGCKTLLV